MFVGPLLLGAVDAEAFIVVATRLFVILKFDLED